MEFRLSRLTLLLALATLVGCNKPSSPTAAETCEGFGDWRVSAYVLPYPAGQSYVVDQGNCSPPGNGHRGAARYGYDFLMPIGSTITAAREGTVIQVEESHRDGEIAATGFDNYVVVRHLDGTTALYGHLTRDGALVGVGAAVRQGEPLALSGNTGNTGNKPHLHFSAATCDPVAGGTDGCPTLPVNFRNTVANPSGPQVGEAYPALTP